MADEETPGSPVDAVVGYDRLSQEYYSPLHRTSRNFDEASRSALSSCVQLPPDGLVLELGAGRGRVGEFLGVATRRIIQSDISNAMLSLTPREDALLRVICDARSTPFLPGSFSAIASFLYDPFNTEELYREVARLLAPGGVFVGTLPAYTWGVALRDELGISRDVTRFRVNDGGILVTQSFLSTDDQIISRCESAGLEAQVRAATLPPGTEPLSPDIQRPADALKIDPYTLPVVQVILAGKPL